MGSPQVDLVHCDTLICISRCGLSDLQRLLFCNNMLYIIMVTQLFTHWHEMHNT